MDIQPRPGGRKSRGTSAAQDWAHRRIEGTDSTLVLLLEMHTSKLRVTEMSW